MDKTFRAGEKFRPVRTETKRMQYLYDSGDAAVFMDTDTYEQVEIPGAVAGEDMKWVLPNDTVEILYVDERATGVQVPSAVDLTITKTDPGLKGDTASGGGSKPATLETGVEIQVPLFIDEGREGPRRHPQRRVRLASLRSPRAPLRSAPRRRLRPLPARGHGAPARRAPRRRQAVHARARRRARTSTLPSSTPRSPGLRRAGRSSGSHRSSSRSCASPCTRFASARTCRTRSRSTRPSSLAKRYCGADAPGFVNGILGAAARELHPEVAT